MKAVCELGRPGIERADAGESTSSRLSLATVKNGSRINNQLLFENNPIPMWVVDSSTLRFLAVNEAATRQYGYSLQEFQTMTLADIRPVEDISLVRNAVDHLRKGLQHPGVFSHRRKDGSKIDVEIFCSDLDFDGSSAILVAAYDLTAVKLAENSAQEAEEKFRALFDDAVIGIFRATPDGRPVEVNRAMALMHGYSTPEELMQEVSNVATQLFVDPGQLFKLHMAAANGIVRDVEVEVYRKDGSRRWMKVNLRTVRAASGAVQAIEGTVEDITERKQAQEALIFKNALLEAQSETTLDSILAVDENKRIVLMNGQFKAQFAVPEDLAQSGDDVALLKYVITQIEDPEVFLDRVAYLYRNPTMRSTDELRLRDGRTLERYSAPLVDSRGGHRGRIWYFRDVTERKRAEEQVKFLAYYDALTGLPNRTLLMDRLESALAGARRRQEAVALMFIDLDQFKIINDSLGHATGDQLLKEIGLRVKTCVREQDTVARVGGDEFVVVLNGIKDPSEIAPIATRIVKLVAETIEIDGRCLNTTCSMGISVFARDNCDAGTLVKYADQAMYCAKESGRNRFEFFTDSMNIAAVERHDLENELRSGLEKGEFFLLYQPQVNLLTGEVTGLEALIRWEHPRLGTIAPDKFIPTAESSGLIVPIGEWVLKAACAQLREWQNAGVHIVPIAVNVSAAQFRQEGFCTLVRNLLRTTSIAPSFIELELTESVLLSNQDVVIGVLRELKEIGVQLAIDDFGTGYSSLSYLKQFRVDKLKIDRTFVRDLATDCDDAEITAAIVALGKKLRLTVIAEGVEDETQLSILRNLSCEQAQGYYFSMPVSAKDIASLLGKGPERFPHSGSVLHGNPGLSLNEPA